MAVLALVVAAFLGIEAAGLSRVFGVAIPYAAFILLISGVVYRVLNWASSPVPFRIPTTAGQQKTLPWIKRDRFDNPCNKIEVLGRFIMEVLFFRSLFRNTRAEVDKGPTLYYQWEKWLWLGGLALHYSLLVIILRHLRFFAEPVPSFVPVLGGMDGFLQVGLPGIYVSDAVFMIAVTYLLLRRLIIPRIRYISIPADYLPLSLILAIGVTGILLRYFTRVDLLKVKQLAIGLINFQCVVPEGIGTLFYIHLFLVCTLIAYFPFSKLIHAGGIFFSPTMNLPNDSRMRRHVNPWDYPVEVQTYVEYEERFREKMIEAGLPVAKDIAAGGPAIYSLTKK